MALLSFKLISMSDGDKGQTIATLAYAWDVLRLIGSFPYRRCVVKYHGRVVWNNAEDKDGWRTLNPDWMKAAHDLIHERIVGHHRIDYDKTYGDGAYDRWITQKDVEHENEMAAASVVVAASVRS